jgi:hypothetical protein
VDDPEKYGKSKLEESWGLMPDVEEEKKKPWRRMGSGGTDLPFLTSALAGGEQSNYRPDRFTFGDRDRGAHWIGGWVGPRAGLDTVEKRKSLTPVGNRTPVVQPVAYSSRYTDWPIPAPKLEVHGSGIYKCTCTLWVYECRLNHATAQTISRLRRVLRLWTYNFPSNLWVCPCDLVHVVISYSS